MERRKFFSTTALATAGVALAACTTGAGKPALSVEQIITDTQAVLSFMGPFVPLVGAFVPQVAVLAPVIEGGLTVISGLLDNLSTTMSPTDARPIVQKISDALDNVLDAAAQAVAMIKDPAQAATVNAILGEARVVAGLLKTFVAGVVNVVAPTAARHLARHVHVRTVR